MAARLRRPLLDWQRQVADVTGERLPSGRLAYPVVVMIVPRRAGKTVLELARKMQKCAAHPETRCWYTAQTGGAAEGKFRKDWAPLVRKSFDPKIAKVRLSNGSMGINFPTRESSIGIFAPTEDGLHGEDSDDVSVDEAWWFTKEKGEVLEAGIRPTMATRRRRQLWIVSAGGTWESTWLLAWRELGRALTGPDQGIAYFEWHPAVDDQGRPVDDLDDPAVWFANHPAVGHDEDVAAGRALITLDTLKEDRKSMGDALFHRSYLDIFTAASRVRDVPAKAWADVVVDDLVVDRSPGLHLAYEVALDRSRAAIVAARLVGDQVRAQVIDERPGAEWLTPRLKELNAKYRPMIGADGYGPASSTTRDLVRAGIDVHTLDTRGMVDASGEILDAIVGAPARRAAAAEPRLVVRRSKVIDDAAEAAAKRELEGGFVWGRKAGGADSTPFVALAVAVHRARHYRPTAPSIFVPSAADLVPA